MGEHPLRGAVVHWAPLRVLAASISLPEVRERTAQICTRLASRPPRRAAGVLTYAEQRALEIGITIAGGADVILLDEPTAGMSHAETERAVALIRRITEGARW